MKLCVPDYYDQFHCIASACRDNCCIGWEIDVDETCVHRYQQEKGTFGQRLRAAIRQEGDHFCFRMIGERCVFLNEQNLCDLIRNLGEDALCQICRDHPRFTDSFGIRRETGLGLCCEEAARLVLIHPKPLTFQFGETDEEAQVDECDQLRLSALLAVRKALFALVQNRSIPVTERMCQALTLGETVQAALEADALPEITAILQQQNRKDAIPTEPVDAISLLQGWVDTFAGLEAINTSWTAQLERVKQQLSQPQVQRNALFIRFQQTLTTCAYEWEQLFLYFLFRYFLKSVYTRDCLTPIQLAVVSCIMIGVLDWAALAEQGCLTEEDRIRTAVLYSKEIEYSEEALAALEEELIFNDLFSCTALKQILLSTGKIN